jgi:hypothetical protein
MVLNRIRYRSTHDFFGDQGIFVRASVFAAIGRFKPLPLMEDLCFARRLRRAGRTALLTPAIKTSPRRFLKKGVARQFVQDCTLLFMWSLGELPESLHARYNELNRAKTPPTR